MTVAFVGRLDALSLSAMVLTSSTYNITGLSLVMGAASGAETLSGQVRAFLMACRVFLSPYSQLASFPLSEFRTSNSSLSRGTVFWSKELRCSRYCPAAGPLDHWSH